MENASKALIIAGAILISILLITIGIVLINSGRDVVDTGTAGMTSQKIQTFNAQFTIYEGTRKGSELRNLVNAVNANNAVDKIHQVQVYVLSAINKISDIVSTKTYTIEVHYNGDGELSTTGTTKIIGPENVTSETGYIDYIIIK